MISPKCIISYPNLFEAKENLSGQMKFSCSILIDKTDKEGVAVIQAAVDKAIAKGKATKWSGKIPKFRYAALRDGDQEIKDGEKEAGKGYEGRYFINCSSNEAPGIVGPDGRPLMDAARLYAGCVVRVDMNPFPYSNSGNHGIGWWLNNVMLVEECAPEDRLDGQQTAENAFGSFVEVEGDLD